MIMYLVRLFIVFKFVFELCISSYSVSGYVMFEFDKDKV